MALTRQYALHDLRRHRFRRGFRNRLGACLLESRWAPPSRFTHNDPVQRTPPPLRPALPYGAVVSGCWAARQSPRSGTAESSGAALFIRWRNYWVWYRTDMFTQEERARLRSKFLDYAAGDPRISGAAITGSAAADREDRWSDIDLAFGVNDPAEIPDVLREWTDRLYRDQSALHHFDVRFEAWIYRVFLLSSTLQVDLAFVPAANFRALAPTFRLAYGRANEPQHTPPPTLTEMIGFSWLYALHGRTCMARQKLWQASV